MYIHMSNLCAIIPSQKQKTLLWWPTEPSQEEVPETWEDMWGIGKPLARDWPEKPPQQSPTTITNNYHQQLSPTTTKLAFHMMPICTAWNRCRWSINQLILGGLYYRAISLASQPDFETSCFASILSMTGTFIQALNCCNGVHSCLV